MKFWPQYLQHADRIRFSCIAQILCWTLCVVWCVPYLKYTKYRNWIQVCHEVQGGHCTQFVSITRQRAQLSRLRPAFPTPDEGNEFGFRNAVYLNMPQTGDVMCVISA
jgi:hypothetical protein